MSGQHNGSWALRAAITLALDSYEGHWCTLNWIISRVVAPKATVQAICEQMVDEQQAAAAVIDGQPCFGVHAHAASRVVA